ncbi:MAG: hypothetical protein WCS43_15930 [Verrucomicrobiota bacterium]
MHLIHLPTEIKLATEDGSKIIDLARSLAESGDTISAGHLLAIDNAIELSSFHLAAADRFDRIAAPESSKYHAGLGSLAENLADFHLWMLDRHLDFMIDRKLDATCPESASDRIEQCVQCEGCGMIPSNDPDGDIMNTRCPQCNVKGDASARGTSIQLGGFSPSHPPAC